MLLCFPQWWPDKARCVPETASSLAVRGRCLVSHLSSQASTRKAGPGLFLPLALAKAAGVAQGAGGHLSRPGGPCDSFLARHWLGPRWARGSCFCSSAPSLCLSVASALSGSPHPVQTKGRNCLCSHGAAEAAFLVGAILNVSSPQKLS